MKELRKLGPIEVMIAGCAIAVAGGALSDLYAIWAVLIGGVLFVGALVYLFVKKPS